MKWNVYCHNTNKKEIEIYNIFDHYSFSKDVEECLNTCATKEEFAEKLRRSLSYYFWAKAEHEIVLTSLMPCIEMKELDRLNAEREKHIEIWGNDPYRLYFQPDLWEKVDIYSQVMNNWEIFVDYVWKEKSNG